MHKSNIQPRLQQRRAAGQDVLSYVGNILECEGGKPDPSVTLDDFRPFLTDDEINSYEKMLKERMRAEAEARAKAETEAKARKEAWEQEQAMFRTLSPDQQDAEITKKVEETIDWLVNEVEESIQFNLEQFIDDRLRWSLGNSSYDWGYELEGNVKDAVRYFDEDGDDKYIEWKDEDLISDFVGEVVSMAQRHVTMQFDLDGLCNNESFRARCKTFIDEVKKARKQERGDDRQGA